MTDENIEKIRLFLAENILQQPDRTILLDEPLITSGLIDSFSLVDVSLYIEDHFGVVLDNTELDGRTFDTLNQLSALIQQRQPN